MEERAKILGAISYITWIGFAVAIVLRDKNDPFMRRHLNQALVLNLIALLASSMIAIGGVFAACGVIFDTGSLVLSLIGIVRALKLNQEPLPFIGRFNYLN